MIKKVGQLWVNEKIFADVNLTDDPIAIAGYIAEVEEVENGWRYTLRLHKSILEGAWMSLREVCCFLSSILWRYIELSPQPKNRVIDEPLKGEPWTINGDFVYIPIILGRLAMEYHEFDPKSKVDMINWVAEKKFWRCAANSFRATLTEMER